MDLSMRVGSPPKCHFAFCEEGLNGEERKFDQTPNISQKFFRRHRAKLNPHKCIFTIFYTCCIETDPQR
jgi:hypothetical protein